MGELTANLPKPMVLVNGKPVLEHILTGLRDEAGITEFFIVIGWCGHVVRDYFGTGKPLGISIVYGEQVVQDGTGKAPELAASWLAGEAFLLSYGDILIQPATDYARLAAAFRDVQKSGGDGVIALKEGEDLRKGGAVVLNDEDEMIDLIEKCPEPPPNAYYNAAIYLLTARIFEFTAGLEKSPRGEFEFTDALKGLMRAGGKVRGVRLQTKWADVRDPGVLKELNAANTLEPS